MFVLSVMSFGSTAICDRESEVIVELNYRSQGVCCRWGSLGLDGWNIQECELLLG